MRQSVPDRDELSFRRVLPGLAGTSDLNLAQSENQMLTPKLAEKTLILII